MLLDIPQHSPYDLQFGLFGFSVRITWTFWLAAAVLGWNWSQYMDQVALMREIDTPGAFILLVIWIACVFLSILVHEMGHALAWRFYGQKADIILYHFGGLAVNTSMTSWDGARRSRISPAQQVVVSAAGPAAQLALAVIVWIAGLAIGMPMNVSEWLNRLGFELPTGTLPGTIASYAFFDAILWTSVTWAILNLAPIFPLDGGQIMYNSLMLTNIDRPRVTAHMVSAVVGGLLGVWMLTSGQSMGGLMFLMLAASNFQQAQSGGY